MADSLRIRRATAADAEALAPLFHEYRAFYGRHGAVDAARDYLRERLERDEAVIFLAAAGGEPVGFTLLYPTFSSTRMARAYELNDLFVMPDARRTGAGRALMEAAVRFARDQAAVSVSLVTQKTNAPARALYESLGFVRDEAFDRYALRFDGA